MRYRFLGVASEGATEPEFPYVDGGYSFMPMHGMQGSISATDYAYPKICTPDEMAEILGRLRVYQVNLSYDATGTASHTYASEVATGVYYFYSTAADVNELFELTPGSIPDFMIGAGSSFTIDRVDHFGNPSQVNVDVSSTGQIMRFCAVPGVTNTPPPYYYDQETELFLPRLDFGPFIGGTPNLAADITTEDLTASPLYNGPGQDSAFQFTASFLGSTFPAYVITRESGVILASLNDIQMEIVPADPNVITGVFWEYRNAAGDDPAWSADDGSQVGEYDTEAD